MKLLLKRQQGLLLRLVLPLRHPRRNAQRRGKREVGLAGEGGGGGRLLLLQICVASFLLVGRSGGRAGAEVFRASDDVAMPFRRSRHR